MKKRWFRIDPDTLVLLKQIGIGLFVFLIFSLLLTGLWHGTRISAFTITEVLVMGGETINHKEIEKLTERTLDGLYLGFIPRRFAWFYPHDDIYQSLSEIDRIHNIEIKRNSGTSLIVTFDEYIPQSLWCENAEADRCLFMNEEGYAFSVSPQLSGGSFVRFIKTGISPKIGENIIETESFKSTTKLIELLAFNDWFVSSVEIDQVDDVFLQIVGGGELKTALNIPPEQTVNNLITILNSEEFSHLKAGNFQYIDLRFDNRVFVNEEKEKTATSSDEESSG